MSQSIPFGLWPSPISPASMSASRALSEVHWDDQSSYVVWLESRGDRSVLLAADVASGDAPRELASEHSVRAKVGYGGGDFAVGRGLVVFADAVTGRLFRVSLSGGSAEPLTPAFGYAAAPVLSPDGRWVVYVHHDDRGIDRLAVVGLDGQQWPAILASGHDFYMHPAWSPDGRSLAFIAWDQPQMPWDGTWLYHAVVNSSGLGLPTLSDLRSLAGGVEEAVLQPVFTADSQALLYVSDASGLGQLYRHPLDGSDRRALTTGDGDYGQPAWLQGGRTFALSKDGTAVFAVHNRGGFAQLQKVELTSSHMTELTAFASYQDIRQPTVSRHTGQLACLASAPTISQRLLVYNTVEPSRLHIQARASSEELLAQDLAPATALKWESPDGFPVHGLFYAPTSRRFSSSGVPPLLVEVHGGPTSQAVAKFRRDAQFFTSRGYAVLYVNYRGSTGYGRAYMNALRGRWGEVDVQDVVSGAQSLASRGMVDGARMVIMGGSAGGFTVLQTMVSAPTVFAAGISLFGVANQFTLVADTHKFEARYSEALLGALPEAAPVYRERSPVFHAHRIKRPLAIFQGSDDKVVPPNQSEAIVKALQAAGIPHIYHLYQGEGHGFRRPETLAHFYQAVDGFLRDYVLFR